ncbi:prephenate dehydrogenase [Tepidibacillus marianensis]|uniref:prephenate dehydrogenase n=1 Tax=Tepidibacillus marianensis TaxID=3131995 RepID=UPI0030D1FA1C
MTKKQITVIGVGLIGGSLAINFRNSGQFHVVGYDVKEGQLQMAEKLNVIDQGVTDLQEAVKNADYIFFSAPVGQLYELLERFTQLELKPGVILSDTGSTKGKLVEYSTKFQQRGAYFIGGHPMAGSHKSGVSAANERLFENAFYVLTPAPNTPKNVVEDLMTLLRLTRAKIIQMDPYEHDQVVGAISHFPHIIAALLTNQVAEYSESSPWYHRLAAGGFRDITRIASSNPEMWRDILLHNQQVMIELAEDWKRGFDQIIQMVSQLDDQKIETFFRTARDFRNQLPEKGKGALNPLYDLFIDVPDHPGVIGNVTTMLGKAEISITNIQILEIREDIMGVLRITFRNENDLERAKGLLEDAGYHVYPRE